MADPNPTPPVPTPPPEPPKKSAVTCGEINANWLDEISTTEKLVVVAAKDAYKTKLAKREIVAPWLTKLTADLERARTLTGQATGKTTGKKVVTQTEKDLKDALIEQIQSIQAAAKQKYFTKNKPALADYFFAKNIKGLSRPDLEACATNIAAKAKDSALPGIEAAELQALDDALAAYKGVETDQSGAQSGATAARKALEALVKEIADQRRELQFAVDGLWPAGKPENAAIRVEFKLPADRAFKG